MFTRVKIKNYKSLINLDVDLSAKKKQPKPLVVIYGENGVGKSNFATAFCTLCESLRTMLARTKLQKLIDKDKLEGLIYDEEFIKFIAENLKDTESIIKSCKTINSTENMSLEFEFVIEGRQGRYLIEYDDSKIVHEKLEYVLNKNRTLFFEIAEDKIKINEKIFTDGEYLKYFYDLLEKYNGKHSFLSILMFEDEGKADGYVIQRISERLYEVLLSFMLMSVRVKSAFGLERGFGASCYKVFKNLGEGVISIEDEEELNKAEKMVNEFFTLAYSDIKEAYYKREKTDGKIKYSLFFKKMMYGKIVDVSYELESTGTQALLQIMPFLLMSVEGKTVIIDELDTGIHDLLINNILCNISDSAKGQLIVTTHNTMFLESSDINPEYIYTFFVDKDANKELVPIVEFEDRTHPNLNYRNRYLKGMYGGIPFTRDIDFDKLLN
jgi:AAA15 family ATPase/GTPase